MKNKYIVFILLSYSVYALGQKPEEVNLLQTDSTWGKEIIQIPFWFAPEINHKGYEDIRFAEGWEDINSEGFWTTIFAWDIRLKTKPTTEFFEKNLTRYLDGLMNVVNENKTLTIPKTIAIFIEKETKNGIPTFSGKIKTYDAFTTKKVIELYVTVESHYCNISKTYLPFFKLSPKSFEHTIWKSLHAIKLQSHVCSN